jgi:hypothetical protein
MMLLYELMKEKVSLVFFVLCTNTQEQQKERQRRFGGRPVSCGYLRLARGFHIWFGNLKLETIPLRHVHEQGLILY